MVADVQPDPVHSKAMPNLIAKLLVRRQAMLVSFSRLAALKPYVKSAPVEIPLQRFCQLLMDYVALGHFEVYQCLEENNGDTERCRRVKKLARKLYPRIVDTTETAVAFNDRYDTSKEHHRTLDGLGDQLSLLGEKLADRIELEDRLISVVKAAFKQPA